MLIAALILSALVQHPLEQPLRRLNGSLQDPRDPEREIVDELNKLERHLAENPDDKRARDDAAELRRRLEVHRSTRADARRLEELTRRFRESDSPEERAALERQMADLKEALDFQRRFGGGPRQPMHDRALLDEVMAYAREFEPEVERRIADLTRAGRMEEAMTLARPLHPRARDAATLKERDPEEHRLRLEAAAIERETLKLAEDVRKAKGDDRVKARERFLEALGRAFAQREEARQRQLKALEKQVSELKEILRKRQENRERIIEKRAQDLLGDDYDW